MTQNQIFTENAIRTFTGKAFDLKEMDPDTICIEDIAHGLSQTARFAGQIPKMYNVAQHSYNVAVCVNPNYQLAALLHDASEAYLGDMPSPFKKMLPEFQAMENKLMQVIASKFGFAWPLDEEVKYWDAHLFQIEWNWFIGNQSSENVICHPPVVAEKLFLEKFYNITK